MEEPVVTGVVYSIFENANPEHPLHKTPYFGQTYGVGNVLKIAKRRWAAGVSRASTTVKEVGLLAMLKQNGRDACEFTVLEDKKAKKTEVVEWLNQREIELIAANGGPIRDMEAALHQTLNMTKGVGVDSGDGDDGVTRELQSASPTAVMTADPETRLRATFIRAFKSNTGYKQLTSQLHQSNISFGYRLHR